MTHEKQEAQRVMSHLVADPAAAERIRRAKEELGVPNQQDNPWVEDLEDPTFVGGLRAAVDEVNEGRAALQLDSQTTEPAAG